MCQVNESAEFVPAKPIKAYKVFQRYVGPSPSENNNGLRALIARTQFDPLEIKPSVYYKYARVGDWQTAINPGDPTVYGFHAFMTRESARKWKKTFSRSSEVRKYRLEIRKVLLAGPTRTGYQEESFSGLSERTAKSFRMRILNKVR